MKHILIIFICLPVFSLKETTPNLCINCKFFTNRFMDDNKFGKCSLFRKSERDIDYFVTGIEKNSDFTFCSVARNYDNMCGKEGKKYIDNGRRKNKVFPF